MVYIYKKIIGTKPYYYLRASERKGKRVITKDVLYLGNSIEDVKKSLNKLPKDKVRKAYKVINNFIESNHLLEKVSLMKLKHDIYLEENVKEVEACKLHYNSVFNRYDSLTKKEILKNFIVEFAFNTASIEGNTITLKETRNLLEEGLTPKDKTLREIYDLQNTEKVFSELDPKQELSENLFIRVHKTLLENIDTRTGYRITNVRVFKADFKSTPAPYVKTDMGILLKWYMKNKRKIHPLALAVIFHHKFEKIHPFMDGNGRTGRIILNYILLKNKYPPVIVHRKFRKEYLEALRVADKADLSQSDKEYYDKLVKFIADEMTQHYWNLFL